MALRERRHDRLVEFGGARPGAVVLGEQLEFAAADIEHDLAAFLQRVALDEADDIADLFRRAVRHHRHRRLAPEAGRLALLRLADQVADPADLILRGIGRPRIGLAERLRRRGGGFGGHCRRRRFFMAGRLRRRDRDQCRRR